MPKTIEELEAELAALQAKLNNEENEEEENEEEENEEEDDSENDTKIAALKKSLNALDKKYKALERDKVKADKAAREAEIAALEKDGKALEAAKKRAEDLEAEIEQTRAENTKLKRDQVLDSELVSVPFRNSKMRTLARRELLDDLVQDEDGEWTTKSGSTIAQAVIAYVEDEDNAALFKTKINSGADTDSPGKAPLKDEPKSILDIPQAEMLKRVQKQLQSTRGI